MTASVIAQPGHSHDRLDGYDHAHARGENHDGHRHAHGHPHGHSHAHAEPASYGPSGPGAVMVDIGPGVGALIIETPAALHGAEIEISPLGSPARTHVAVRGRLGAGAAHYAAIYPSLPAGRYTVWNPEGVARCQVEITGATVTRLTW